MMILIFLFTIMGLGYSQELIDNGEFLNSTDFPAKNDYTPRAFKFDNYSGSSQCEKEADKFYPSDDSSLSENQKRCNNGTKSNRDYQYYTLGNESNNPLYSWLGDGYSELFPGGRIKLTQLNGYQGIAGVEE